MAELVLENYTKHLWTCYNLFWFVSSPFYASLLIHYTWCYSFYHFTSSKQVNNSFCCSVIILPAQVPDFLFGIIIFRVASWITRYVYYVKILQPTIHPYLSDEAMVLISSIKVQEYAAEFPLFMIFDTHGRLGKYIGSPGKFRLVFKH